MGSKKRKYKGTRGRPPIEGLKHVKVIKRLTIEQVAELASIIVTSDMIELERIAKDRATSSVLQVWYANVAVKGIKKGDANALNAVLDRIVGTRPNRVEVTGDGGGPLNATISMLTPEERLAEIKRLEKLQRTAGND